ncbi:uncharacterized protein LOC142592762 [Dermacentor variabilis]|uniref:uncharacterized protein LOC142592762 n=1 Tax=Dermacentor variabilis TaxID=34621 RepID=UPI003F5C572E
MRAGSSEAKAIVDTVPLIAGLEVVVIIPECEAFSWNDTNALAHASSRLLSLRMKGDTVCPLVFLNSIKTKIGKAVELSFSAASWKATSPNKKRKKTAVPGQMVPTFFCLPGRHRVPVKDMLQLSTQLRQVDSDDWASRASSSAGSEMEEV